MEITQLTEIHILKTYRKQKIYFLCKLFKVSFCLGVPQGAILGPHVIVTRGLS